MMHHRFLWRTVSAQKRSIAPSRLLILFLSFLLSAAGGQPHKQWRIAHRGDRTLQHAARKLQDALQARGSAVESASQLSSSLADRLALIVSPTDRPLDAIVVPPAVLQRSSQLKPEGYYLVNHNSTSMVLAACPNGALYGSLELARQLLLGGPIVDTWVEGARFSYRALKFNMPESPYRPGRATEIHAATVRSFEFWRSFLDMMAQNKFNVLSLWQLEPWQYLIQPRHFPKAALPPRELQQWRALYSFIFKEAQDR